MIFHHNKPNTLTGLQKLITISMPELGMKRELSQNLSFQILWKQSEQQV